MAVRHARSYDTLKSEMPPCNMTHEKEIALAARILSGDADAAGELVSGHLRFGISVANRYHRAHPAVPLPDLVSASFVGLMNATRKYDGRCRFISYASHWVHQQCRLELASTSTPVRLPPCVSEGVSKVKAYYAMPENAHKRPHLSDADAILTAGGKPLVEANAKRSFVESAIVSQHYHKSLDVEIHQGDGQSITHKDRLLDATADPSKAIEQESSASLVRRMVAGLPARQQYIIQRYFLGDPEPVSLDVIAQEMGVTRERIRQIKNEAVEYLRKQWAGEISLLSQ